jgi:hypothetical protein
MREEKLEKYIFSENALVYAILDGAAIPDLPMRLFEMRPSHVCLYRGELDDDLAEVAPYLVNLQRGTRFTSWILEEGWGKHWGIFVHSLHSLTEMRKHFRKFLTVHDENGNPMLFRFYDPRVLPTFLPTCEGEELELFFDKVKSFYAESDDAAELIRLQLPNGQLKQASFLVGDVLDDLPPAMDFQRNQFAELGYA